MRHAWCKNQDEIFSSLRRYHTIQNNNSKILYFFIWQTNEDISKIAFYSQLCLASLSEKVYMLEYLKEPVIPTLANGSFCRNTCRLYQSIPIINACWQPLCPLGTINQLKVFFPGDFRLQCRPLLLLPRFRNLGALVLKGTLTTVYPTYKWNKLK